MLTNNVVSFEQPGPGLSGDLLSTVASCGGFSWKSGAMGSGVVIACSDRLHSTNGH